MKAFVIASILTAVCTSVWATGDESYSGQVVSASKEVSVRYEDGSVVQFDVVGANSVRINNERNFSYVSVEDAKATGNCGKLIGLLASDYSLTTKTDENELVTVNFKASTPEHPTRISGDCDGTIKGKFTIYQERGQPLDLEAKMNPEPAGPPAKDARYYGEITAMSPKVYLRQKDGVVREFNVSSLKFGGIYNDMGSLILSRNGMTTRCGSSLGFLAQDFSVTIKTKKGMVRTATVHAQGDQVGAFGVCNGSDLSQFQLGTRNQELFDVQ